MTAFPVQRLVSTIIDRKSAAGRHEPHLSCFIQTTMAPFHKPKVVLSGLKERFESLTIQGKAASHLRQHMLIMILQLTGYILEVRMGACISIAQVS